MQEAMRTAPATTGRNIRELIPGLRACITLSPPRPVEGRFARRLRKRDGVRRPRAC